MVIEKCIDSHNLLQLASAQAHKQHTKTWDLHTMKTHIRKFIQRLFLSSSSNLKIDASSYLAFGGASSNCLPISLRHFFLVFLP